MLPSPYGIAVTPDRRLGVPAEEVGHPVVLTSPGIARRVRVDPDLLPAGVSVEVVAMPGHELTLPPAGHGTGRYALAIAVAATAAECRAGLDAAATAVRLELLPARTGRRGRR